jgi:hypothetical protein
VKQAATRRAGVVAPTANIGGLASGPLIAGLLARYEPQALTLPFTVFLPGLIAAVVAVILAPEGHAGVDPRPRYHPQRLTAPANGRRQFVAATTGVFTSFAVGGLLAGLTGTFLAGPSHHPSPALTGLAIFLTFASGVLVQTTTTSWPTPRLLAAGIAPIIIGLSVLVVSGWTSRPSLALFLIGAAVAGAGIGAITRGSLTVVITIVAGLALQHLSPRVTLLIFASVVAIVILAATPMLVHPAARAAQCPGSDSDPMTALCRGSGEHERRWLVHDQHRGFGVCDYGRSNATKEVLLKPTSAVGAQHNQAHFVLRGRLDDPFPGGSGLHRSTPRPEACPLRQRCATCGHFLRGRLHLRGLVGVEVLLGGKHKSDVGRLPNAEHNRFSPGCKLPSGLLDGERG